jgi:L,D-transpeptidase YbiS
VKTLLIPVLLAVCHWWQFQCVDGLPAETPRTGTVITVDLSTNTAYLFNDGQLVRKSACARGSEKTLENGDDMWLFRTPRGHLKVLRKIIDPVWRKPDWAFIEAGEKVPPPDSPKRLMPGKLGKYALDLGEGILIHGTDDASSIGRSVSHGCVRLPNAMLAVVFKAAKVGTDVFIFESSPQAGVERHSDLEFATATSPSSSPAPDRGGPESGSTQSGTPQRRQQ